MMGHGVRVPGSRPEPLPRQREITDRTGQDSALCPVVDFRGVLQ